MHGSANEPRSPNSLADVLQQQAARYPERTAFVFEDDDRAQQSLTFGALEARTRTLGNWLSRRVPVGERALLVYPPGLEFISAFWGCIYAGVLPVPATYPKPRRPSARLNSIFADSQPRIVLTQSSVIAGVSIEQQSPELGTVSWEATDDVATDPSCAFQPISREASDLAFLQYTSGSTSDPRGVMVTHQNLLHNLAAISACFGIGDGAYHHGVFWLPAYHDMGLIGSILTPLYVAGTSTLLAPTTFLRKPLRWIELMSETRGTISGAPNFGYELVARKLTQAAKQGLELSSWNVAFCGAEPINAQTLEEFATTFASVGFAKKAFSPCFGLAESTLLVTGGRREQGPLVIHASRAALQENRIEAQDQASDSTKELVGCGPACLGMQFEIVDATGSPCADDQVGEIWVQGDSVASGYWGKQQINETELFGELDSQRYMRTGDLGFRHAGELFVTGRVKDVIIVRGRNHYPQDLESTAQNAHTGVDAGAAFSVEVNGREEVVLVHQWRREHRDADHEAMMHAIRTAIVDEHEIDPHAIVLIRPASLPITSSGKVQRQKCRDMFLANELSITAQWLNNLCGGDLGDDLPENGAAAPEFLANLPELSDAKLQEEVQAWLVRWLAAKANLPAGQLHARSQFAELGIDSMSAVEISQELDEVLGLQSPPMIIWTSPTPAELAEYLAGELKEARTAGKA